MNVRIKSSLKLNVTFKVENKITGCLQDSQGMLATMYVNDGDKEQRKVAGIRGKYDRIIVDSKCPIKIIHA